MSFLRPGVSFSAAAKLGYDSEKSRQEPGFLSEGSGELRSGS